MGMNTDTTAELERAFATSDATYDTRFVVAVRTTGIYCRPSCRVRKPFLRNVSFLADAAAARAAGYRACLRCHPDDAATVTVRHIDTPVGTLLAGATERAVVLCDFADRRMIAAQLAAVRRRIGPTVEGTNALLDELERQLRDYFAGEAARLRPAARHPRQPASRSGCGASCAASRTARRSAIASSPPGSGRAARSERWAAPTAPTGSPSSCRATASSRAGGGLGGYGGGLDAKRRLLGPRGEDREPAQRSGRSALHATMTPTSSYFHTRSTAAKPAAVSQARCSAAVSGWSCSTSCASGSSGRS